MKFVTLTLLIASSLMAQTISSAALWNSAGTNTTESRVVELPGYAWLIEATYNAPGMVFTPAVAGPTHSHYQATFKVFELDRGKKLIAEFDGQFTGFRCFEDRPDKLVSIALGQAKKLTPEIKALFAKKEATEEFEAQPLYRENGSGLEVTPRGKRDLKYIEVDGVVVWGKKPPLSVTGAGISSVVLTNGSTAVMWGEGAK